MLLANDLQQLKEKQISEEQIKSQLASFEAGFPFLEIEAAAAIGAGIRQLDSSAQATYLDAWNQYTAENHKVTKFVPASGAASRMFKNLFAFMNAEYTAPQTDFEKKFVDDIEKFAFYEALNDACVVNLQKTIDELFAEGAYQEVVAMLLQPEGLNYGALPKGMLQFHSYDDMVRTPVEEHLVEGALYAADADNKVSLHFTVSDEHMDYFQELVASKLSMYEEAYNVKYDVTFSVQKPSTDTLAVEMDNTPFRNEDGSLLFRPGGHGALIQNLNDLDSDIVFVKNIDNVVPDRLKADTVLYKKLLAGVLVATQKQAFEYLELLDSGEYSKEELLDVVQFVQRELCCRNPELKVYEDAELVLYLKNKLNRPIRVCGMVKNVGEPGGGPFLAYNPDGTFSPQILESSQIDMNDPEKKSLFEKGTHFNPVDLVCAITDKDGKAFDLPHFIDPATGFISYKSKNGRDLKALELPGLWNGAMSDWSTIFVEVPLSTFNPVKTVNDLLREQHQ
ncbi:MAG TPA: DUF4301 family protein [Bacteroidaceae bacterium]|nr:DUF4301 family protein [Bacteroidaceae bacterium]